MPQRIEFEGEFFQFPDDATDNEIYSFLRTLPVRTAQPQPDQYQPAASFDDINSAGAAALGFGKNLISSGGNLLGAAAHMAKHPVETAKGIGKLAVGTAGNAAELIKPGLGANIPYKDISTAFGDFYANRYGGLDRIGRTAYEDPVGMVADLASVLSLAGGGLGVAANTAKAANAASVASKLATTSRAVGTIGKNVDPLVLALRGTTGTVKGIAKPVLKGISHHKPEVAQAVKSAAAAGVPIDAATATGNRAIGLAQWVGDHSLYGSLTAGNKAQRQAQAMTKWGTKLADEIHPASVTREGAGMKLVEGLTNTMNKHKGSANTAYNQLREIESNPANRKLVQIGTEAPAPTGLLDQHGNPIMTSGNPIMREMGLPIDLRNVKPALKELKLEMDRSIAPDLLRKSNGYKAIESLLDSDDFMPLSEVDRGLSEIKKIARLSSDEALRNANKGRAAYAANQLESAIRQGLKGDKTAIDLLLEGRAATRRAYNTENLINKIAGKAGDPDYVTAFNRATAINDSKITTIRKVFGEAPETVNPTARAWLDNQMYAATEGGGFTKGQTLWSNWEKLGSERQTLMFGNKAGELNDFFLTAKEISKDLNPSGTGRVAAMSTQLGYIFHNPMKGIVIQIPAAVMAKALHSRAVVKFLTEGMKINSTNSARITTISNQLRKIPGAKILRGTSAATRIDKPINTSTVYTDERESEQWAQEN